MLVRFRSIHDVPTVPVAPVAPVVKAPKAKWHWVVVFADRSTIDVPVARGAKDARLQAMWIVKERTGEWPTRPIVEVQKRPTGTNGLVYMSYRRRR
jgi:hypothetical protein